MNPISSEVVEKTWKRMGGISLQEMPKLVYQMSKEQPFVFTYLMGIGSDLFNQDERELLLYLGMVVWQMMSQGTTRLPKVTEKILDKAEESNMQMIEYLEDESEAGFIETVEKVVENYNQQEVLKYVVEALMEGSDEESLIRDKSKGMMAIYLKTVIDGFDR